MAQTIKLRRSATQNAVPTTAQLALGEVAINTYDGRLFLKKSPGGVDAIVDVGNSFNGTLAIGNGGTGATSAAQAYSNLTGFTSTATSGGTTTLTNTSSYYQFFTGTSAHTIVLPATSTLAQGTSFHLVNNSTNTLTVQTSAGAATLGTIPPGITMMPTSLTTSGNLAADWEVGYTDFSTLTGTGANVLATSPTLVTPLLGTPTSGTLTNCTGLPVGGISATGTPSASTYLRGDGAWAAVTSGSSVTVSLTAPASPSAGDLWWKSDEGQLKIYYTDANTSQWVDASAGVAGPVGPTGAAGADGVGVPVGGTAGQVLIKNSSTNYDTSWGVPALTYAEGLLGADVQLAVTNQWYDGPTVTIGAGTWLFNCHLTQIRNATTAESIYARISDGTNHFASQQAYHASASGSGTNLTMTAIGTTTGTTTIKGQIATSAGATTSLLKAAMAANSAGNNASMITALRIA